MKACDHCDQKLLALEDFPEHVMTAVTIYLDDLRKFMQSPMTDDDRRTAETFFREELHESERWVNFIVWLIANQRVTGEEVLDMLDELNKRVRAMIAPNPSKFKEH